MFISSFSMIIVVFTFTLKHLHKIINSRRMIIISASPPSIPPISALTEVLSFFLYINCNKLIFLHQKSRCCKYYTLNTMYIKLHKIIMDKKPNEIHKNLIPTKLSTIQYSTNCYNWPVFLTVNTGYTSSYAFIGIHY